MKNNENTCWEYLIENEVISKHWEQSLTERDDYGIYISRVPLHIEWDKSYYWTGLFKLQIYI